MAASSPPSAPTAARTWGVVLWPAFVAAGVLELLVFALLDPQALHLPDGSALPLSRTAVYSLAFLLFWAVIAAASAMALWLARQPGGER
jgi:hypothetical protein